MWCLHLLERNWECSVQLQIAWTKKLQVYLWLLASRSSAVRPRVADQGPGVSSSGQPHEGGFRHRWTSPPASAASHQKTQAWAGNQLAFNLCLSLLGALKGLIVRFSSKIWPRQKSTRHFIWGVIQLENFQFYVTQKLLAWWLWNGPFYSLVRVQISINPTAWIQTHDFRRLAGGINFLLRIIINQISLKC